MNCKISCSFGEVVDKYTILKIKESKTNNKEKLKNIQNEIKAICLDVPEVYNNDELFKQLFSTNLNLWNYEDLVREKSKKGQFDESYILCAESIHKENDKRYLIKKYINEKYNSELKEEKIYKNFEIEVSTCNDVNNLEIGKKLYTEGKYYKSLQIIEKIMKKYENNENYDSFYIDLLFSYNNICNIFNKHFSYFDKLTYIMDNLPMLNISVQQKKFCCEAIALISLKLKNYKKSYDYLNLINYITGPNINFYNMGFFSHTDVNKTLLLYDGGGIGDVIMFMRFIPLLCNKYNKNKITFLINHKIYWMVYEVFKIYNNLKFIPDNKLKKDIIGNFDYHCSQISLIKHLKIEYNSLKFKPLLKELQINISNKLKIIIDEIKSKENTYIFNWKGNAMNKHELTNRQMKLENAIPLFKIKNINWIVINPDANENERSILSKYNVKYYGDIIDKEKSFYDSISIIKNVCGVFSTDTSLLHLSANLDATTYALLTTGCEWRWTSDLKTNWYPNITLLRQETQGDWTNVIKDIIKIV